MSEFSRVEISSFNPREYKAGLYSMLLFIPVIILMIFVSIVFIVSITLVLPFVIGLFVKNITGRESITISNYEICLYIKKTIYFKVLWKDIEEISIIEQDFQYYAPRHYRSYIRSFHQLDFKC